VCPTPDARRTTAAAAATATLCCAARSSFALRPIGRARRVRPARHVSRSTCAELRNRLKEKIENKKQQQRARRQPRKALGRRSCNRDDGPQCDKCLRRFCTNESLRNHKARIHDGKTSKDFECLKCHKKFSKKEP
jgi:hypothetical protein